MHSTSSPSTAITTGIILPIELWILILQTIRNSFDGQALVARIATISSALRDCAEDVLYRSPAVSGLASVTKFRDALVARQRRAQAARCLSIRFFDTDSGYPTAICRDVVQAIWDRLPNLTAIDIKVPGFGLYWKPENNARMPSLVLLLQRCTQRHPLRRSRGQSLPLDEQTIDLIRTHYPDLEEVWFYESHRPASQTPPASNTEPSSDQCELSAARTLADVAAALPKLRAMQCPLPLLRALRDAPARTLTHLCVSTGGPEMGARQYADVIRAVGPQLVSLRMVRVHWRGGNRGQTAGPVAAPTTTGARWDVCRRLRFLHIEEQLLPVRFRPSLPRSDRPC